MKSPLPREQLEAVAAMFAVLAEPTRLALLQALRDGDRPVGDLVVELDARQANVSKQLGILHAAGLVVRERHGNEVHYSIRDPIIFELCELVCGKLRRDAERQARAFRPPARRATQGAKR
jgi:DNA-binding transcriptional ArsR family regulator